MAVLMVQEIPGGTREQYDRINEVLGIHGDTDAPEGLVSHTCGVTDDGLLIVDVWDSEESFGRFFEERLGAALAQAGVPEGRPPRVLPVHSMIPQGAGTQANVIMIAEVEGFGAEAYDRMTGSMEAHADGGRDHPAVSHVAAVAEHGGVVVVDLWDSPESFGRFAEEQVAPAGQAIGMGPIEPRFVPVHKRIRGKAAESAR